MIPTPTASPDISIIVPVYNAAQTLDRCLGSITSSRVQKLGCHKTYLNHA